MNYDVFGEEVLCYEHKSYYFLINFLSQWRYGALCTLCTLDRQY